MSVVQVLVDPPAVNSTLSISPLDPRRRVTRVKQEQNDELHAMHNGVEAEFQVIPCVDFSRLLRCSMLACMTSTCGYIHTLFCQATNAMRKDCIRSALPGWWAEVTHIILSTKHQAIMACSHVPDSCYLSCR